MTNRQLITFDNILSACRRRTGCIKVVVFLIFAIAAFIRRVSKGYIWQERSSLSGSYFASADQISKVFITTVRFYPLLKVVGCYGRRLFSARGYSAMCEFGDKGQAQRATSAYLATVLLAFVCAISEEGWAEMISCWFNALISSVDLMWIMYELESPLAMPVWGCLMNVSAPRVRKREERETWDQTCPSCQRKNLSDSYWMDQGQTLWV